MSFFFTASWKKDTNCLHVKFIVLTVGLAKVEQELVPQCALILTKWIDILIC